MKSVWVLVVSLFFSGITYGQKLDGGLFAGLSTCQIDGDGLGGFNLAGLNLGFFTQTDVGQKGSLRLELAFLQKGAKEGENDSTGYNTGYKLRLNYIEVPLVYIFHWKDLAFEIGLGVDILVNHKESDNGGNRDSQFNYHRFSMMGLLGVTYNFSENWGINFRSNNSITPISDGTAAGQKPSITALGGYGMRNDILTFALVYKFNQ